MVVQFFPRSSVIENQKNEKFITYFHVTMKAPQVAGVVSPVVYLVLNKLLKKDIGYLKILSRANMFLIPFCAAGCYYKVDFQNDMAKNKKRGYLLQRNFNQYFYEDWTALGFVGGLGYAAIFRSCGLVNSLLLGSSLGFYFAVAMMMGTTHGLISGDLFNAINFSTPKE